MIPPAWTASRHGRIEGERRSDLRSHPCAQLLRATLAFLQHDLACEVGGQYVARVCMHHRRCRWPLLEVSADAVGEFELTATRADPDSARDLEQFRTQPVPASERRCVADVRRRRPLFIQAHTAIVALLTRAPSGLGAETARALTAAGAVLTLAVRNADAAAAAEIAVSTGRPGVMQVTPASSRCCPVQVRPANELVRSACR